MADSEKIDEMHGMLHAMKPMLEEVRIDQKSMDSRMRSVEVNASVHTTKIDRIQTDLDGLGRKVRHIETRPPAPPSEPSHWTAIADFMAAIPAWYHFAGYTIAGLISAIAVFGRGKQP